MSRPIEQSGTFTLAAGGSDPLSVRRLGFGAMRITGPGIWGDPADRANAIRVLRTAVDLGVDFIDTADSYGPFVSEDLIREALYPYDGVVIATKGGLTRQGPDAWAPVGRPEYLHQCVQMSLRRLGVERIDLWQLHRIDPKVPRDEQFGIIKQMQDQGLIRHVGLSEVSVADLVEAQRTLDIVSVQNLYNVAFRASAELLDHCTAHGIGFIPWFPLGNRELVGADGPLAPFADELDCTPSQVALAWLLKKSPAMVPIPGTGDLDHLRENCEAATVVMSDEMFGRIDAQFTSN
jgi:aryl-alcohol dehydrogenase-like predicted oxidoreductase